MQAANLAGFHASEDPRFWLGSIRPSFCFFCDSVRILSSRELDTVYYLYYWLQTLFSRSAKQYYEICVMNDVVILAWSSRTQQTNSGSILWVIETTWLHIMGNRNYLCCRNPYWMKIHCATYWLIYFVISDFVFEPKNDQKNCYSEEETRTKPGRATRGEERAGSLIRHFRLNWNGNSSPTGSTVSHG